MTQKINVAVYNVTMNNDDRIAKAREILTKMREDKFNIEVEVLNGGKLPDKKNPSDAGFDLYATSDITIYPGQVVKHPLNIRMKLPHGTWGEITTKSGLGSKGQLVYAGVIDQNYRGIPHVIMTNVWLIDCMDEQGIPLMRIEPLVIKAGQKVAQLIMNPHSPEFYVTQVDKVDTNTDRGEGGFGSTGA